MDDDSLSRRAADITAHLNHQAAMDRLTQSTWPQHGGGSTSAPAGVGGSSSIGFGTAMVIALVISAIAGGFGGAQWFATTLMISGGFVVITSVVVTLTRLVRKGDQPRASSTDALGSRSVGLLAMVLLGAIAGAALGSMVPMLLGEDIAMREGILMLTPVGAAAGAVVGGIRIARRR
jgi:hypothetical protein